MKRIIVKPTISLFVILVMPFVCLAQKLPNIQQAGLRAPTNLKIDGKVTEWEKFQAYNHATDIYYTICNDDSNLYMVVHANDPDVLTKITNTGVVFSINPSGEKSDTGAISITYPIFELQYGNKPYIMFSSTQSKIQQEAVKANPDSMVAVANKKLHDNEKYIRTSNMQGIDTLLSVYNTDGIKARESFDSTMSYTYELSIPLKYLNLNVSRPRKFAYHFKLPRVDPDGDFGLKATKAKNGVIQVSFAKGVAIPNKEHVLVVASTTEFWGEYTLAR